MLLFVGFSFAGCNSNDVGSKEIKAIVLDNLEKYYGGDFEIRSIKKNNVGVTAGFKDRIYDLQVYSGEENAVFNVRIFRDGSNMSDDFEKTRYMKTAKREIERFACTEDGWTLTKLDIRHYGMINEARSNSFDEYKSSDYKLKVNIKLSVESRNIEETSKSIYSYLKQFHDNNYNYVVDVKYGDKSVTIKDLHNDNAVNTESIEKALKELETR